VTLTIACILRLLSNFSGLHAKAYAAFCSSVIEEQVIKNHEVFRMTKLVTLFIKCVEAEGVGITDFR